MNENSTFVEEAIRLTEPAMLLLRRLDPEPVFVKKYIKEICKRIKEEGWLKQPEKEDWIKSFEREKYLLRIAFIHARKGEHITGADLVFELEDKKIIFIQSKREAKYKRILFNRFQLFKLLELEGQLSAAYPLPCILDWYNRPCKAAFYHLIMEDSGQIQERFFHVSEIYFILGRRKSISTSEVLQQGLDKKNFEEMFWDCQIGCPDISESEKKDMIYFYSLYTNRMVILLDVRMT